MPEKSFDFETMAVVLYAMLESGVNLGGKHYTMMSAIDSKGRGPDSFNHQFREVKARAKQLQQQAKKGEISTTPKSAKSITPATRDKKNKANKRGRKSEVETETADIHESPTKKMKTEVDDDVEEEEDYDDGDGLVF